MIRWSAHLSTLFPEEDPLARPAAARAAGFGAVESWWPEDPDAWGDATVTAGVDVVLVNAFAGDIAAGDRGFLTDPARQGEAIEHVQEALALAARLRCPHVNVLAGHVTAGGVAASRAAVADALAVLAPDAAAAGVVLVVEPLNPIDVPGYAFPDAPSAVGVLERVASPAVRLLYDSFHAARRRADPAAEVRGFARWIAHVQYADTPARGAPGTGTNDLAALLEALANAGYSGAIGLEIQPRGSTAAALDRLPHRPDLVTALS